MRIILDMSDTMLAVAHTRSVPIKQTVVQILQMLRETLVVQSAGAQTLDTTK